MGIDFRNTILVLTSNIGCELFGEKSIEEMSTDEVKKVAQRFLSPELMNRLDDIVVFKTISREAIRAICRLQLERVKGLLASRSHSLTVGDDLFDWLCEEGYNEEYGVRPLKRLIISCILDPVASAILEGNVREGGRKSWGVCKEVKSPRLVRRYKDEVSVSWLD